MQTARRRLVRDLQQNKVGEVMDKNREGTVLYLRPVGGGIEWEAPANEVQDVDPAQPEVPAA